MVSPRVKRESTTAHGGLVTPSTSYRGSTTVTPKRETSSFIDLSLSDAEEAPPRIKSHHGLPSDRGYSSIPSYRSTTASTNIYDRPSYPPQGRQDSMQPPTQVSSALQGLELVGKNVKILVDAISDLQKFGLSHVAPLPELVLVGDQSAGKSSLMSALTEVQLPRDQGTCTRCPANIKTSPADTWSCTVALQQNFRYVKSKARKLVNKPVTDKDPFPPWERQELVNKPFITLDEKDLLEDAIRWAQLALLNHDEDSSAFIPGTGHRYLNGLDYERSKAEAKFSPNLIAIEISGPGLPALSFYDLPGNFAVSSDPQDGYLADVVTNLSKEYIKRPNALVIYTMAMKTDPANMITGRVINDCKATSRCVGVLTNPDHLQAKHNDYEKMLQGKWHILKHGYFVTRQPGEADNLPIGAGYHAEARLREQRFFDTNELWVGEWRQFRDRCGTGAIQKFLSHELASSIVAMIPDIQQKIAQETHKVDIELAACPDLPHTDVRNVILKYLSEFSSDVRRVMDGEETESGHTSFMCDWTSLLHKFVQLIKAIKPMIGVKPKNVIEILTDDEDDAESSYAPSISGSAQKRRAGSVLATPAAKRVKNHMGNATPIPIKFENSPRRAPRKPQPLEKHLKVFGDTPFLEHCSAGRNFANISEIQTRIKGDMRPGMPGVVNPKTYNYYCTMAVSQWKFSLEVFLDHTIDFVRENLLDILHRRLYMYDHTELYRVAVQHLEEMITGFAASQRERLTEIYEHENYKCFTVNDDLFEQYKASELAILVEARKPIRIRQYFEYLKRKDPKKYNRYPQNATDEQREEIDTKHIQSVKDTDLGVDPFERELGVAAYVRGYYITATNRFVDNVCLSIHGAFFRQIRDKIALHLETKLGINGPNGEEICRELMAEDASINDKRKELRAQKEKLVGFNNRLDDLLAQLEQEHNETATQTDVDDNQDDLYRVESNRSRASARDVVMEDETQTTVGNASGSASYSNGLI